MKRNLKRFKHKAINLFNNKLFVLIIQKTQTEVFMEGLIPRTKLLIETKIDGYAIALKYRDGKLNKSINKEDKDVKNKIIKVQDIPK